jgi:hypothetical protein
MTLSDPARRETSSTRTVAICYKHIGDECGGSGDSGTPEVDAGELCRASRRSSGHDRPLGDRSDDDPATDGEAARLSRSITRATALAQSEAMTQHTLGMWQRRTSTRLSESGARQILENVVGFFATLDAIDRRLR